MTTKLIIAVAVFLLAHSRSKLPAAPAIGLRIHRDERDPSKDECYLEDGRRIACSEWDKLASAGGGGVL